MGRAALRPFPPHSRHLPCAPNPRSLVSHNTRKVPPIHLQPCPHLSLAASLMGSFPTFCPAWPSPSISRKNGSHPTHDGQGPVDRHKLFTTSPSAHAGRRPGPRCCINTAARPCRDRQSFSDGRLTFHDGASLPGRPPTSLHSSGCGSSLEHWQRYLIIAGKVWYIQSTPCHRPGKLREVWGSAGQGLGRMKEMARPLFNSLMGRTSRMSLSLRNLSIILPETTQDSNRCAAILILPSPGPQE